MKRQKQHGLFILQTTQANKKKKFSVMMPLKIMTKNYVYCLSQLTCRLTMWWASVKISDIHLFIQALYLREIRPTRLYKPSLLTEFEVRTVSYGPSFFRSNLWPKRVQAINPSRKKQGSVTYSTERENKVCKIFIMSLESFWRPKQTLAGCTVKYGPLNWPITGSVLTERYNKYPKSPISI